jgi:hypothetical protein
MSGTAPSATGPVRKQITVRASQRTAFEVFTGSMATWWNPEHHIGEKDFVDVVAEPRVGGRWFERDAEGTECQWGSVRVWSPYDRVVLAWQLDAGYAYDPGLVTEVDVRFVAEGPTTTRVELEHRGFEEFGADGGQVRGAMDSPNGWSGLLSRFAEALTSEG